MTAADPSAAPSAPGQASPRELAPVGPLGMLDRAVEHVRRHAAAVLIPAWGGGGLFALALVGVYYVERVEGIHGLRPLLALLVCLAWVARAWLLGRASRRIVQGLHPAAVAGSVGRVPDVTRTSLVVGAGLWVWAWLLVLGSFAGVVGVLAVLPLFSFRGLSAPSWIARASCAPEAGFRGFFNAFRDTQGRRGAAVLLEGLVLAGAVGLALNLYACTFVFVLLGRSFLGLDVTAVSNFLAPTNVFLQVLLGALALVLLEPLRASLSAVSFVDASVRAEGLDLRAGIEAAIQHAGRRRGAARAAAVLLMLAIGAGAPVVHAQQAEDAEVAADVQEILARPEFREFEDTRGRGLRHLFEDLFEWMMRPLSEVPEVSTPSLLPFELPGGTFFLVVGGALMLAVFLYLWLTRRRDRVEARRAELSTGLSADLRDRAPATFLDEAAQLAQDGRLREALRSLYLATLVSLDRRRLIAFDPHRTNWHYLRAMPGGQERDAFRDFTRLFDHKWYGREGTTQDDYELCRRLASAIVANEARS
ncbi:MAG: DUF4129 domain-containing protein [Sandaracinaceae bacterium]